MDPEKPNNFAKELRQQFPKTDLAQERQATAAVALGINAIGMVDTLIADMQEMIQEGQRYSLQGYILCLSKIISHQVAWKCITRAFAAEGETVPVKYQKLFQKQITDAKPIKPMSVS